MHGTTSCNLLLADASRSKLWKREWFLTSTTYWCISPRNWYLRSLWWGTQNPSYTISAFLSIDIYSRICINIWNDRTLCVPWINDLHLPTLNGRGNKALLQNHLDVVVSHKCRRLRVCARAMKVGVYVHAEPNDSTRPHCPRLTSHHHVLCVFGTNDF